ncbi:hypothetical protein BGZ65_011604 [Modicella reniformis]|uniref:Uncharacterized protein n=1 Tax=Modicella reniformis TaxID=1440133 RepID=A0A9P6J6J3_9FUNG|nr:hypothetical protein BGZ65_011604 [Modicella reniformis]
MSVSMLQYTAPANFQRELVSDLKPKASAPADVVFNEKTLEFLPDTAIPAKELCSIL